MKVSIKQSHLMQVLQDVRRVIPSKPTLPILQAVLIEADKGDIVLSATDLYTGIRSHVLGSVETPGRMAVPAQALSEIVATLPDETINLSFTESKLQLSGSSFTSELQCFSADDFPPFPEKQGEEFTLPQKEFEMLVQYVPLAIAKDDSRPVLTSVLFEFGKTLEIVATDGFRLTTLSLPYSGPAAKLLIPGKALHEVARLQTKIKAENVSFTVSQELKQVFCRFAETEMVIRLMEGEFPPYEKIIPASFETQAVFLADEFLQALKGASVFARESSNIVRLSLNETGLTVSATSPSLGKHESRIALESFQGKETKIAFNATYLLEFISTLKPVHLWFGMNESLQPALFRPDGMNEYRYIVMPFRVND